MSVSISYFFNSDKQLRELVDEINEGVGLGICSSAYTAFPFFGMELSLSVNESSIDEGYTDVSDLKFSHYNFELDVTTYWGQADARHIQLPILLSAVYALHRRLGITGMLVYDVQILLACYEERQAKENYSVLFDTVSQTEFTRFTDHLAVVQKRLPAEWRQGYMSA